MQGGFIWDWVDQGLLHKVKDASGKTVEAWGYGGDFGDPVHDAQFNINGLIWPNRQPHPGCWECKAVMVSLNKGIMAHDDLYVQQVLGHLDTKCDSPMLSMT